MELSPRMLMVKPSEGFHFINKQIKVRLCLLLRAKVNFNPSAGCIPHLHGQGRIG
jgi:hypothetical protein